MQNAVGVLEMKSISRATLVADICLKSAAVTLQIRTTCPGKCLIFVYGEISSVKSAIESSCNDNGPEIIDYLLLGNIHPGVFPALFGTAEIKERQALGIIETFTVPAAVKAADEAAKSAQVEIIDLRAAQGLGGKGLIYITGGVGAVQMALDTVKSTLAQEGTLLDVSAYFFALILTSGHKFCKKSLYKIKGVEV